MSLRTSPSSFNLGFVLKGTGLFFLVAYLSIAGGKFSGLVVYPLYLTSTIIFLALGFLGLGWRALRRRSFPATPLDLGVLAFILALGTATGFSEDPRRSLEVLVVSLVYILFFYLVVDLLRAGWDGEQVVVFILVCSFFYLLIGTTDLINWFAKWNSITGWQQPIPPTLIRIHASIGHANILAAYLNLLLPLGLARLVQSRRVWIKVLLAIWSLLCLGLIYCTSSRGGWIATGALLFTFALLLGVDQRGKVRQTLDWLRRRWIILAGVLLLGVVVVVSAGYLLLRQLSHPSHPGLCRPADARNYIWQVGLAEFRRDPLTGAGPGIYPRDYLTKYSIPPLVLLPHAHNIFLGMLGEAGLPGFLAVLLLVTLIIRMFILRWRLSSPGRRTLLIGSIAALVGLATHSQFDIPQTMPLINLISVFLIAMQLCSPPHPRSWQRIANLALYGFSLFCGAALLFFLRGYAPFNAGLEAAAQGNWPLAAMRMETAARLDPNMAHYWFQAGFARGMAALQSGEHHRDQGQIDQALADYRRGLALYPGYALEWANLGRLELLAGDDTAGLEALRRAVEIAPRSGQLLFALAMVEEQLGLDQAAFSYFRVLQQTPEWRTSTFLRQTAIRRRALAAFSTWHDFQGKVLDGQSGCFLDQFQPVPGEVMVEEGWNLLSQGRFDEARIAFHKADFIAGETVDSSIDLGNFYRAAGFPDEAVSFYRRAYNLLLQTSVYGPGTSAEGDYWLLYQREGLAQDLFPVHPRILITSSQAEGMRALAGFYDLQGENDLAAEIRRFIGP